MKITVVGMNHKTASLAIRESSARQFADDDWVYQTYAAQFESDEFLRLATCNRFEFYLAGAANTDQAVRQLIADLSQHGLNEHALYVLHDEACVQHLYAVSSGLDSLMTGENQILGQVKQAYLTARKHEATGPYLNRLFEQALSVGKRIRTETDLNKGNVSVGSAALDLAEQIFSDPEQIKLAVVGTGKMGTHVLKSWHERQQHRCRDYRAKERVLLLNRTQAAANELEKLGLGCALALDELPRALKTADVVITSIATTLDQLTLPMLREVMAERGQKSLFLVDLGVPRNLNPELAQISNVYLYNLDDLQHVAQRNLQARETSRGRASSIVDQEVRLFYKSMRESGPHSAVARLSGKFEAIRVDELQRTLKRFPDLGKEEMEALDVMTKVIVKRILHDPVFLLKAESHADDSGVLSVVKRLFRLDDEETA